MFGALVFDRDPWTLADVPAGVMVWFQVVGGFALAGAVLFALLGWPRYRKQDRDRVSPLLRLFFVVATAFSLVCYAIAGLTFTRETSERVRLAAEGIMTLGGVASVLAAGLPFLFGCLSLSPRRIFALAKLSFKEAISRKILLVFVAALFLLLMFSAWFVDSKPEDQVRTYVFLVFVLMSFVLLIASALVSAFSIPADVKNQTIHTVVTKPVQRFEIILGRFLGFFALMTLVLLAFTGVSLLYVLRTIRPEAAEESVKARVPLYGELRFENTGSEKGEGINVGREWDYRGYIAMGPPSREPTAKWTFRTVPASLADRDDPVRFEYTFDVYRTTKGQEGEDVRCVIRLETWRYDPEQHKKYLEERGSDLGMQKADALAEKYGYFEIQNQGVTDYHTQRFEVPAGLFKNAVGSDPKRTKGDAPAVTLKVTCASPSQYVGMARHDLYARLDRTEGTDYAGFSLNFFKAAFGLWLLMALVIGLSVVMSSYLSGVITLLATATLFGCGGVLPFIEKVAMGKNEGGGPAESMLRLARRELSGAKLEDSSSTTERFVSASDEGYRRGLRLILKVFPDVNPLLMRNHVGEGFSISWEQMAMTLLPGATPDGAATFGVLGYLLPWFVLGYYAIRWREIAGAT
jgi:hypothetical protein